MQFEKIAPYLKDPLVLIGFFLFLGFLFCRFILKQGIIPTLPPTLGFRILRSILLYGFLLGLLISALGFFLKYREMQSEERVKTAQVAEQKRKDDAEMADRLQQEHMARQRDLEEQQAQISRLDVELTRNLGVADQLRKNTIVMLGEFKTLSEVVRTPGIQILTTMFPAKNLDLKIPDSQATGLADDAMDQLGNSGLLSNQLERQKVTAAANAIAGTVQVTRSTVQSLQDADRKRYVFSDDVWKAERSNIEKVVVTDLAPYQTSYGNLALLRTNYDVLTQHFVEYLADLESFFDPAKHLITREGLRQILAKERYTESLLVTYSEALSGQMAQLKSLSEKLHASKNLAGTPVGGQAQVASSKWQGTRPSVSRASPDFSLTARGLPVGTCRWFTNTGCVQERCLFSQSLRSTVHGMPGGGSVLL